MQELNRLLEAYIQQKNEVPLEDFDGLSSLGMHQLLYAPFSSTAPIQWNPKNDWSLLTQSPMFHIIRDLLTRMKNENGIKLTGKGNLNRHVINAVYSLGYLPDRFIEEGFSSLRSEEDWPVIHNVKQVLLLSPLARKYKQKLVLTKQGHKYLEAQHWNKVFEVFFINYTTRFNWAYNDAFLDPQMGQLGAFYLLYLLHKYGDSQRKLSFYTTLYFRAFPQLAYLVSAEDYRSPPERIIYVRFFDRFAHRFGFVEYAEEGYQLQKDTPVSSTPLLKQLFLR